MNNSGPVAWHSVATGETKPAECFRGTVRAKTSKHGGMGSRKSQRPDSTDEVGESMPGRPGGGKGGVKSFYRWRET